MPFCAFPGCLLCQRGCSSSLLLRNTGPQGLKWSRVITNRSLIGTDSMETSQSGTRCSCLNYSDPRSGALETANEGHAPEAKSPGHQLPAKRSVPRRTSTGGTNPPKMLRLHFRFDWVSIIAQRGGTPLGVWEVFLKRTTYGKKTHLEYR